jgi:hypothetical protein
MDWTGLEMFLRISVSLERRTFLEQWFPRVRFQISSKSSGGEYYRYLHDLLVEFFTQADYQNKQQMEYWRGLNRESGTEGETGIIYIEGEFIDHCKLFWYEKTIVGNFHRWKGLLFIDHDGGAWDLYKVYRIADAFEKFLKKKKIAFRRYGVRRVDKSEVFQN